MSVEWLKWAFEQEIESGAKFVLVSICNYANPINPCDRALMDMIPDALKGHVGALGFAWPSQEHLQKITCMGERTVRRHIDNLESRDLILSFQRRRPDGRKSSDGYLLITSPAILAAESSPAKLTKTSPAKLAGTYEDTQGLIHKSELHSLITSVNKTPLPPFSVASRLSPEERAKAEAAMVTQAGWSLSFGYMAGQYDDWVNRKGISPRNVGQHFIDFIHAHKGRNKL